VTWLTPATSPSTLTVNMPVPYLSFASLVVPVEGQLTSPATSVLVNGQSLALDPTGLIFSGNYLATAGGSQNLTVTATGPNGTVSSSAIPTEITLPSANPAAAAPQITISGNGISSATTSLFATVTVSDPYPVLSSAYVNGQLQMSSVLSSFSVEAPYNAGESTPSLTVVSSDTNGKTSTAQYLFQSSSAPQLTVTQPTSDQTLTTTAVPIQLTSNQPIASVVVNGQSLLSGGSGTTQFSGTYNSPMSGSVVLSISVTGTNDQSTTVSVPVVISVAAPPIFPPRSRRSST